MRDPFAMSLAAAAIIQGGWADVVRCVADARARHIELDTVLILIGPPRAVARIAPIEACECQVVAVGVDRADFVQGMRDALGRLSGPATRTWAERIMRDIEGDLDVNELRILIAYDDASVTVATTQAPTVVPIEGASHAH
jgi:hypothetical protein